MDEFISEPIQPEPGRFDPGMMARGLASLPPAFTWRGRRYEIIECLDHTKRSSPEGGRAEGERYLRGQRFTVRLDTGQIAVIDFHRQSRAGAGARWTLYTITSPPDRRGEAPVGAEP